MFLLGLVGGGDDSAIKTHNESEAIMAKTAKEKTQFKTFAPGELIGLIQNQDRFEKTKDG